MTRTPITKRPYADYDYPLATVTGKKGFWPRGPEFFQVEELPLYPFSGDGEHAAIVARRTGMATRDLAKEVASILSAPGSAVGYAGMKDKDSTATQSFTVTGVSTDAAAGAFEKAGAAVLLATRHKNKLRLGHLLGNRFTVSVRGGDPELIHETLKTLEHLGAPNFFGPQRFGADGRNALDGLKVLEGKSRPGRWKRDLAVSALQSLVFNEVLALRMERAGMGCVFEGDLLQKTDTGGIFVCEDTETDGGRAERGEVAPTGPMHGKKMKKPLGWPLSLEEEALNTLGLSEELFRGETGARRMLFFRPGVLGVKTEGDVARVEFSCPAGSYATSVVREFAESGVFRV